jgi:hypothetical protein
MTCSFAHALAKMFVSTLVAALSGFNVRPSVVCDVIGVVAELVVRMQPHSALAFSVVWRQQCGDRVHG